MAHYRKLAAAAEAEQLALQDELATERQAHLATAQSVREALERHAGEGGELKVSTLYCIILTTTVQVCITVHCLVFVASHAFFLLYSNQHQN